MVALDHSEATFWHMAVILVHLGVIWGSLWGGFGALWGDCGVTLGWLWGHVGGTLGIWRCHWVTWGHFGVTLAPLWEHCGVTFGVWRWLWETWRVLWGHSELTLSLLLACENDFGVLMVSSRVYEGQFSKTNHFPNEFE